MLAGGITARGNLDTPVLAELTAILAREDDNDVILIDDAREFGKGDYPRIDAVAELIVSRRPGRHFEVRNDIIRARAANMNPDSSRRQFQLVERRSYGDSIPVRDIVAGT